MRQRREHRTPNMVSVERAKTMPCHNSDYDPKMFLGHGDRGDARQVPQRRSILDCLQVPRACVGRARRCAYQRRVGCVMS